MKPNWEPKSRKHPSKTRSENRGEKRGACTNLPGGSAGGAGASSIVLNIYKRLIFISKRLNVQLLSLAPLSLHTSSFDVPSPDVNLKGSALPADPKNIKKLKIGFSFWKIIDF